MKQSLSNLLFIWKICFKASPKFMLYYIYDIVRSQMLVFLEHTILIRYVLKCIEYQYPFYKALIAIGIVFVLYLVLFIPDGYYVNILSVKEKPKLYKAMRERVYHKATNIDLACYDDADYYSDFVLSIAECDKVVDRFLEFIKICLGSIMIFVTTGVFYIIFDAVGMLFLVAAFFLSMFVAKQANKINYAVRMNTSNNEKEKKYVGRLFYLKDFAKEMRLYPTLADRLKSEYSESNQKIRAEQKKAGNKRMMLGFVRKYCLTAFITDGLYIAYLMYKVVVLKKLDLSNAIVLFHRTNEMRRGLTSFSDIIPKMHENNLYIEKIRNFLDYKAKIESDENGIIPKKHGDIVIENVSFKYKPDEDYILKDISLNVKAGEHIAIVGYNGAGKTTLIKLLMRLYDPSEGNIRFGDDDISGLKLKEYRDRIGVIFQDYQIYGASVRDNVILDDINKDKAYSDEKVTVALENSGFKKRLEKMEKGINTPLTTEFDKKGVNLSGGESQKVATSRCFYKNADILIMDEPSSALDPIAEYSLNSAMKRMADGKTVFYISHRLSTTRDADRIIMLEKGRIVECGTHSELLSLNGKYAEMWRVQAGRYNAA